MGDEANIQAVIDAMADSNGIPEGQAMGGTLTLPAGTYTCTAPIKLKTATTLRGAGMSTLITGAIPNRSIIEVAPRASDDTARDIAIENLIVRNTDTGGAIGIAAEATGGFNTLRIENVYARALSTVLNLRAAGDVFSYALNIKNVKVWGSRGYYIDALAAIQNIDVFYAINNRESESTTANLTTGAVCKFEGGEIGVRVLWAEGPFYRRLGHFIGRVNIASSHFEAGKSTADGVPEQLLFESSPLAVGVTMPVTLDNANFISPTKPIRTTGTVNLVLDNVDLDSGTILQGILLGTDSALFRVGYSPVTVTNTAENEG